MPPASRKELTDRGASSSEDLKKVRGSYSDAAWDQYPVVKRAPPRREPFLLLASEFSIVRQQAESPCEGVRLPDESTGRTLPSSTSACKSSIKYVSTYQRKRGVTLS